ncbi:MAG: vitamin K epoxide reductase [Acidobacteria bacterium]|nr:vitamin K epoxide reductase [Acidobacteriota bacterium]MBA3887113.1 vitamin K epoxide reductase [Acidobacteriota bacterium]
MVVHDANPLDVPAPPWDYNPSAWRRRIPICVLAGVAFVISAYLALYQWRLIGAVWDPLFGEQSQRVLDSDVSHEMQRWLGVPDGALGAIAYLGDVVLGLAGSTRRWQYRPWLVALFGLLVIPVGGVSALLVLTQFAVLGQRCFLCLAVAAISLTILYLAYGEVWASLQYLRRVWRRTRNWRSVARVFWGRSDADGEAAALEVR